MHASLGEITIETKIDMENAFQDTDIAAKVIKNNNDIFQSRSFARV